MWAASRQILAALVVAALTSSGLAQDARQPDAKPLARYFAADGLAAYFELDGLDAHREAWRQTAAHAVLSQTPTGAMIRSVFQQSTDGILARADDQVATGAELAALMEHVAARGLALGVHSEPGDAASPLITIALPGCGEPARRDLCERLIRARTGEEATTQVLARSDGRKIVIVTGDETTRPLAYWFEGSDLIFTIGRGEAGAEFVIASLGVEHKSLTDSDVRAGLAASDGGFEPVARGWVDPRSLPPTPPALGLSALERIDYRWGFDGKALVSQTRLVAPSPRQGVLALLDQPAIDAAGFPPIPTGVSTYVVASIDLARAYDTIVEAAGAVDPAARDAIAAFNTQFSQILGAPLREGLLPSIGPRFAGYVERGSIRAPVTPLDAIGAWLFRMPPLIGIAEARDPATLGRTLDNIARAANGALAGTASGDLPPGRLETLAAPDRGYQLFLPPHIAPLPTSITPAIVLGPKHIVVSSSLPAARRIAALGNQVEGRLVPDPALFRPGTILLEVHDAREGTPELIANIPFLVHMLARTGPDRPFGPPSDDNPFSHVAIDPKLVPDPEAIRGHLFPGSTIAVVDDHGLTITTRDSIPGLNAFSLAPVAAGLLLPAVQSAREAAYRSQAVNNLKQIALAMHNYLAATNEGFPAQTICDKDGNPLLSWRVAILPYLEQQALYEEFHLDEPWDSEHNKTLIDKMPAVYGVPGGRVRAAAGHTFSQVLVGNGALFEADTPVGIADVTDGTSNTLLVVEAKRAVPWTKPEDLDFDPEEPVPAMGGLRWRGGFNAAFADGSVRFLKFTIAEEVLRALITRAGGEVVSQDSL
jgi:prepilin-type processing-associated H-X9-DG protein